MRFDDMIGTVMAQPQTDAVARQIVWRQLVDILAQSRGQTTTHVRARALNWLESARQEISPVVRASVARSVAPRIAAPDLVNYFAHDDPAIAAPVLSQAQLTPSAWRDILVTMPPSSRALLRERRDLPEAVTAALSSFGSADYALSGPKTVTPEIAPSVAGITPIADIVARIEAFRARREAGVTSVAEDTERTTQFHFETDAEGVITFIANAPREALIGLSIATAGEGWLNGVDGHAAGAFRARSSFRGARLSVAGAGATAGDWVIEGDPMFEPNHGAFLGFRGNARRPLMHERAERLREGATETDNLRQLVHELRTPLNAIQGFAEMIERQMLGPVDTAYRERAREIMHAGARVLHAIEDVDTAARIDTQTLDTAVREPTDAAALLTVIGREFAPMTELRHIRLRITRAAIVMPVAVAEATLHRLFSRLIGAVLAVADAGETLAVALIVGSGDIHLHVQRPRALLGREEHELLDPDYSEIGDSPGAPLLGLGFGLRLIQSLARAVNVKFHIESGQFVLILPAATDSAEATQRISLSDVDDRTPARAPIAEQSPA